jgi:hypothetical protein
MTEVTPVSPFVPQGQDQIDGATGAPDAGQVARFEQLMTSQPGAETAVFVRNASPAEPAFPAQLIDYVNGFDDRFRGALTENIESVGKLDFTDPMSMVKVMEVQAQIFSVTMELQLAAKLAESGRHFVSTLFQNQV